MNKKISWAGPRPYVRHHRGNIFHYHDFFQANVLHYRHQRFPKRSDV